MYVARRSSHLIPPSIIPSSCRAGPSRLAGRPYTAPTSSRSAPMPQLRETYEPPAEFPPPSAQPSSRPDPVDMSPLWSRPMIQLPPPLPSDSLHSSSTLQHAFYPTVGVIDSISMISMCLRRKEHIPRAYQIFQTMLKGLTTNASGIPDAQLFGKVVEGTASLAEPLAEDSDLWRKRAQGLVRKWEQLQDLPIDEPALEREGVRVYAGWLTGLVK